MINKIKTIKNISILSISSIVKSLLIFIQGVYVIRYLGPDLFGIWSIVISIVGTLKAFFGFRTQELMTLSLNNDVNENIEKSISVSLKVDLIGNLIPILFVFLLVGTTFYSRLNIHNYRIVLLIYAIGSMATFTNNTWFSLNRNLSNYKNIFLTETTISLIQLLVVMILIELQIFNLYLYSISFLMVNYTKLCIQIYSIRKNINILKLTSLKKIIIRKTLFKSGAFLSSIKKLYISSTFSSLIKKGDVLIIGFFFSAEYAAFFKVAKSLVGILSVFTTSLTNVIIHDISKLLQKFKVAELKNKFKQISLVLFLVVVIGYGFTFLFGQKLIVLIYGMDYSYTYKIFVILLLGESFKIIFFWTYPTIISLREFDFYVRTSVVVFTVGILFMIMGAYFGNILISVMIHSGIWIALYSSFLFKVNAISKRES